MIVSDNGDLVIEPSCTTSMATKLVVSTSTRPRLLIVSDNGRFVIVIDAFVYDLCGTFIENETGCFDTYLSNVADLVRQRPLRDGD